MPPTPPPALFTAAALASVTTVALPISGSTCIASAEYDALSNDLTIHFHHGGSHTYPGVPASVVVALVSAPSAGQFFNANIRNVY